MPDICMCKGSNDEFLKLHYDEKDVPTVDCPLKAGCYRYKAKPCEHRQSYFLGVPFKGGKCKFFMALTIPNPS